MAPAKVPAVFLFDWLPSRLYTRAMVWLIRKLFWFCLFLVATFCFVVLFEHGTSNYAQSAQEEFEKLRKLVNMQVVRKKDESDKIGR